MERIDDCKAAGQRRACIRRVPRSLIKKVSERRRWVSRQERDARM
jgi:hypothetical protein